MVALRRLIRFLQAGRSRLLPYLSAVFVISAASRAHAHPGHTSGNEGPDSITHYLLHPEHYLVVVLLLAAAIFWLVNQAAGDRNYSALSAKFRLLTSKLCSPRR